MTDYLKADCFDAMVSASMVSASKVSASEYYANECRAYTLDTIGTNPNGFQDLANGHYDIY